MTSSPFADHYGFLARYNRWFNQRLYEACSTLSDEERKRDRGAFFGSIHQTLGHLIWGDTVWLGRFARQGVDFPSLRPELLTLPANARHDSVLFSDFEAMRVHRDQLDVAIDTWVADMPPDFPERVMRYGNTKGVQREHPMWQAMSHFFNHQTHHRGQVTTLLMQAGIDPGTTDLISLVSVK